MSKRTFMREAFGNLRILSWNVKGGGGKLINCNYFCPKKTVYFYQILRKLSWGQVQKEGFSFTLYSFFVQMLSSKGAVGARVGGISLMNKKDSKSWAPQQLYHIWMILFLFLYSPSKTQKLPDSSPFLYFPDPASSSLDSYVFFNSSSLRTKV